jgi:hypothetical protein
MNGQPHDGCGRSSPLSFLGRSPPDPTLFAGVGESDRRLARGPAARVLPLSRHDAPSTEPG